MSHRRFIALATDAAPTYATYLPLVVRLWRHLDYQAIVQVHDESWETPFGFAVLEEAIAGGAVIFRVPTCPPLSIPNTMRCTRLVAAASEWIQPSEFLLTADVDMLPLSRTFFDRDEPWIVYRGLGDTWMQPTASVPPRPPKVLQPGLRFPMCYSGATVEIWRELLPIVVGDFAESLHRTVEPYGVHDRADHTDLDETIVSRAFLTSPRMTGQVEELSVGVWRQGEFLLVDPIDAPQLTPHEHMHRGMLLHGEGWMPGKGDPPNAFDFIPQRFYPGTRPWWCFDVATIYFPELTDWITSYRARIDPLL